MHWAGGRIEFATARQVGTNNFVRISAGSWFTTAQLGDCYSWELSLEAQIQKANTFQSDGWEKNAATNKGGSGKLSSFRYDDTLFKELGGLPVAMQLYIDKSANIRWDFFALLQTIGPKSQVGVLIEQDASFVLQGEAVYATS